jgi:hypothetical protein
MVNTAEVIQLVSDSVSEPAHGRYSDTAPSHILAAKAKHGYKEKSYFLNIFQCLMRSEL